MESSAPAPADGRELTITEKLILFRRKKEGSRKENEAPSNKILPAKRASAVVSKPQQGGSIAAIPVERRKSFANTAKPTLHSTAPSIPVLSKAQAHPVASSKTQSASVVSSKAHKEAPEFCTKLPTQQVEPKERAVRSRARLPTPSEFKGKIDEYIMLAQNAGIEVARSFMSTIPHESNMKDVETQALYWLTWIRYEGENEEWEVVSSLFEKAKVAVKSLSGVQAILTAEQKSILQRSNSVTEHSRPAETTQISISSAKNSPVPLPDSDLRISGDLGDDQQMCSDVRLLMGEDGFSIGELSDPKTLRFSMGETDPNDTAFRQELLAESTAESIVTEVASAISVCGNGVQEVKEAVSESCPALGKYAQFMQSTIFMIPPAAAPNTTESTIKPIVCTATDVTVMPIVRSVSSHISELEYRVSKIAAKTQSPMPKYNATVKAVEASSSSADVKGVSLKKIVKRREIKSPGGASLDILLGLGGDNECYEVEEGMVIAADDVIVIPMQLESVVQSDVSSSSSSVPLTDSLSALKGNHRSSRKSISAKEITFELPAEAQRAPRRGRAQKVQVGVSDIFSDDEDDAVLCKTESVVMKVSVRTPVSTRKRPNTAMDVDEAISTLNAPASEDMSVVDVVEVPSYSKRRRSTLRRPAVSFSNEVCHAPKKEIELSFEDDLELVIDSFDNTLLASGGCRRSRRLSGPMDSILGSGSAKKNKVVRRGTPRAADRPRFSRPSSQDSSGSAGSRGSEWSEGSYGSYFGGMVGSFQFGEEVEGDFNLLATTPVVRERRSRRLSQSNN